MKALISLAWLLVAAAWVFALACLYAAIWTDGIDASRLGATGGVTVIVAIAATVIVGVWTSERQDR